MFGTAIGLGVHSTLIKPLQTADNISDQIIEKAKPHMDKFDELDKATGRKCPKNE